VFAAIQRRIEGGAPQTGWWQRLGVWRAFSAIGAAAVVVLALTTTFVVLRPPAALSPSYVAVLSDSAAQPAVVVTAYKGPWRLNVETLAPPALPPGKVLQVWAIEKGTGIVRPLVALTPGQPQQLALTEAHWKLVKSAHSLAVNIEPAGSTPAAPTTPVLYSGLCLNLKGV
jgi:anti-sigma-K factor RskA